MSSLYPLRFQPVFRRYLWGGRRLHTILGKPLGEGSDYAESWEVVDHGADQSVIAAGPLQGVSLQQLVRQYPAALFGRDAPQKTFPLLLKYLDAQQNLSLQVHPDDEQAARLQPPDRGKTEAWVVLHAEPGSVVYAGLQRGLDRQAFERELRRGTAEPCMHRLEVRAGDCIFIPAGVIHALGKGILLAEIQQASDTTFRLWDWNRVGPDGTPRPLHLEQGLAVANFDFGPVKPQKPQPTDRPYAESLVRCDKFVLERWCLERPIQVPPGDQFLIVSVLAGEVRVSDDPAETPLRLAETVLLPADRPACHLQPVQPSTLLVARLP